MVLSRVLEGVELIRLAGGPTRVTTWSPCGVSRLRFAPNHTEIPGRKREPSACLSF